jgi:hypothetical protein
MSTSTNIYKEEGMSMYTQEPIEPTESVEHPHPLDYEFDSFYADVLEPVEPPQPHSPPVFKQTLEPQRPIKTIDPRISSMMEYLENYENNPNVLNTPKKLNSSLFVKKQLEDIKRERFTPSKALQYLKPADIHQIKKETSKILDVHLNDRLYRLSPDVKRQKKQIRRYKPVINRSEKPDLDSIIPLHDFDNFDCSLSFSSLDNYDATYSFPFTRVDPEERTDYVDQWRKIEFRRFK